MTDSIEIDPVPATESAPLLRHQLLVSQTYALGMAHWSDLAPEEAGRRFYAGIAETGSQEPVQPQEHLETVVVPVGRYLQLIHGIASMSRQDSTWTLRARLTPDLVTCLDRWDVPLDYYVRWLAEIQRLEGKRLGFEWRTWLDGDTIVQELQAQERVV